MENIFELNIFENNDLDDMTSTVDYVEFSAYVESLDKLINEYVIVEAAVGQYTGIKKGLQNTDKSTRQVAGVYGDLTDAGGSLIDALFQLTSNSASLIVKILKFIITKLSKIPLALANVIKYLTNLPPRLIAKIRGDIELYVTVDDLAFLQNRIQGDLGDFITLAISFTRDGDYDPGIHIPLLYSSGDFKTYKAMNDIYMRISNVKFEKTIVKMNHKQVVDTYLSPKSQYYKFLEDTLKFLNDKKPEFEKLAKAAGDKFNANQIKGIVSKLSPGDQLKAKRSTEMISRVVSITGNLVKYLITDISTINKTVSKLLDSDKQKLIDGDNVDKVTPNDSNNKQ